MILLNNEEENIKREFVRLLKDKGLIYEYKFNFSKHHTKLYIRELPSYYDYSFNSLVKKERHKSEILRLSFTWSLSKIENAWQYLYNELGLSEMCI